MRHPRAGHAPADRDFDLTLPRSALPVDAQNFSRRSAQPPLNSLIRGTTATARGLPHRRHADQPVRPDPTEVPHEQAREYRTLCTRHHDSSCRRRGPLSRAAAGRVPRRRRTPRVSSVRSIRAPSVTNACKANAPVRWGSTRPCRTAARRVARRFPVPAPPCRSDAPDPRPTATPRHQTHGEQHVHSRTELPGRRRTCPAPT